MVGRPVVLQDVVLPILREKRYRNLCLALQARNAPAPRNWGSRKKMSLGEKKVSWMWFEGKGQHKAEVEALANIFISSSLSALDPNISTAVYFQLNTDRKLMRITLVD
jgi:hypothetical protein